MDSKELSSISDCFGDKKAIKIPKLNTIWLELIARVLNMLIGLKGDNYYSKAFKRVNYRLSNSTFWVVIRYQANPKESSFASIKRIIRYFCVTLYYGLWYPYDFSLVIASYSNVDLDENVKDRKNTSNACFFLLLIVLWFGLVRNKILYLYLLSKLNTLLLEVIVHNSCGRNKCWKTIRLNKGPWTYIVTTLVL